LNWYYLEESAKTEFRFITAMSNTERTDILNMVVTKLQEKYPNIEFVNDSGADYNGRAKLAFSSGAGYDLILTDDLGISPIRDAGYLMDLSPYFEKYNWEDRQNEGASDFYNQRTPGQRYTVGMNYAPVTVYYNKTIFEELNLEIPKTLAEYENILKVATEAGYIGAENAKENVNGWYIQSMVQNFAPYEDILNWYYLEESAPSIGEAFKTSFDLVKKWSDAGYFRDDYEGIDYGDTPMLFSQGKTAMSLDGNWMLNGYEDGGVDVGIFAFPSVEDPNQQVVIINPVDAAFGIGAQASEKNKEIAVEFIDLMLTPEIAENWLTVGSIPSVTAEYSNEAASPLTQELLNAIKDTKSGYYLDNAKAGFLDVFIKEIQLFTAGDQTSEETWGNIDKFWNEQ
ncbi:MAG: ABC transporter substrate-binding protein, partial [Lachnospirales bacterium]